MNKLASKLSIYRWINIISLSASKLSNDTKEKYVKKKTINGSYTGSVTRKYLEGNFEGTGIKTRFYPQIKNMDTDDRIP